MYVLFISFLHVPCIERAVLWHFSALTDPLIAGIARGSDAYKLVGSYVATPLNWYACSILQWSPPAYDIAIRAVITGTNSKYQSISDLKDTTIGISRPGRCASIPYDRSSVPKRVVTCSGSQTMAAVMALQEHWFPPSTTNIASKLNFKGTWISRPRPPFHAHIG